MDRSLLSLERNLQAHEASSTQEFGSCPARRGMGTLPLEGASASIEDGWHAAVAFEHATASQEERTWRGLCGTECAKPRSANAVPKPTSEAVGISPRLFGVDLRVLCPPYQRPGIRNRASLARLPFRSISVPPMLECRSYTATVLEIEVGSALTRTGADPCQ